MYKQQEISVSQFFGGISDDPRKISATEFQISKHFDIFSQPNRLTPYRSLAADTNDGSTSTGMKQYAVRDFVYASASTKLYGLGQNGAGQTKIVYKADATTGNWTLPASSEGNSVVWNGCFFEFQDYLWGFQGTNQIWKYGLLSGSPSITNTATGGTVGSTITSVANGIIASDANAYLAYNNVVVRISSGLTITDSAKTVPSNFKIVSLANYGNYLAVGCAPVAAFNGVSKTFIWNLSSDLFQETIDWGEGVLAVNETIEGMLVAVIDRYMNNAVGAGRGSMIIQGYASGQPQVLKEVFTQALTGKAMPNSKAVKNNRLFFSAKVMTNSAGTTYDEGIWSFGRKNAQYPWALTLDVIDENVTTAGIQAFGTAANYFFLAHSSDGSIDKTSATATYSFTSIYESQIFNMGDVCLTKRLDKLTVYFAPLPASSSMVVKIKVDSDTSWTTIATITTTNLISRDIVNIESTGADLPTGKEFKIRLESSVGGGEFTGFKLVATPLIGSI